MEISDEIDNEIQCKIDQARKKRQKNRNYDGQGDIFEKEGHQGAYLGPRKDIEKPQNHQLIYGYRTGAD